MVATTLVIVPIHGKKDSCLLVHVTPESASQPLDLTLRATDGVHRALKTKLDEASIIASKDPRFKGTDADVKTIFSHIFLKTPVADAKLVENAAVEAKADGDEAFKLRVFKNYGKVKQTVVSIIITDTTDELDIFGWAKESCAALEIAQGQLAKHEFEKRDKDKVIKDLTEKLEALALLKKEHEDLLLVKFKELLNTKKAKIRELGRQLEQATTRNGADEEPEDKAEAPQRKDKKGKGKGKAATPEPEPAPTKGRRKAAPKAPAAAPVRAVRKRKAVAPSDSDDSDFAASKMDIDGPAKRSTRSKAASPPPPVEDDETTSGSEDEAQMSEQRDSEDELPPVRKPIDWGAPKPSTSAAAAKKKEEAASSATAEKLAPEPAVKDEDETDDEL